MWQTSKYCFLKAYLLLVVCSLLSLEPFAQCKEINLESFEGSIQPTMLGTWRLSNLTQGNNAANAYSGTKYLIFDATTDTIRSPLITKPSIFSFYLRRSGGTNEKIIVELASDSNFTTGLVANQIARTSITSTYAKFSYVVNNQYVRVRDNRTSGANFLWMDYMVIEADTGFSVWKGETNFDWFEPTNWCQGLLPDALHPDVIVPAGCPNQPIISNSGIGSGIATIRNVTVQSGATLSVSIGGLLKVSGNITSTRAIINANNLGTIELNGISQQTLLGSYFSSNKIENLKLSNPGGVVMSSGTDTLKIGTSLSFGSSNCVLTTNGNLELLSTSNRTARIEDFTNGGLFSGNRILGDVTVQRYIPLHTKPKWELMAVPTMGKTVNACWQEGNLPLGNNRPGFGTILTTTGANATSLGFDTISINGPSVKYYSTAVSDYVGVGNTADMIANNTGYMLFVRGDRSVIRYGQTPTATTLRTSGQLYTPLDNPPPVITVPAGKFQCVNNFYASPIKFDSLIRTGSVQNAFYLWDPAIGDSIRAVGGFQTFVYNPSTGNYDITPGQGSYVALNTTIESGNAFFVKDAGSGGTIQLRERAKLRSSGSISVNRPVDRSSTIRCNLYSVRNNSSFIVDGVLSYFSNSYHNTVDAEDIEKLGINEGIALLRNGKRLAAEFSHHDTLFLGLTSMRTGTYQLSFSFQNMSSVARSGTVFDRYLQTTRKLNLDTAANYLFEVNTDPRSYAVDRFFLVLNKSSKLSGRNVPIALGRNKEQLDFVRTR